MTAHDFLMLARLLLVWRANFALSHRFRDVIDEIAHDCIKQASNLAHDNNSNDVNSIPL